MKKWLGVLTLAVVLGGLAAVLTRGTSFDQELAHANAALAGPQTQAALEQYPDTAPTIFAYYGEDAPFQTMMVKFGHNQTFPIIAKCLKDGDDLLNASFKLSQIGSNSLVVTRSWINGTSAIMQPIDSLTPEACGVAAIDMILEFGNTFLGRYDIDSNGVAHLLPGTAALSVVKTFMTHGLAGLEKAMVRGGKVTNGQWAEAGFDALGVVGVGKVLGAGFKVSLAAKAGAGTGIAAKAGVSKTALAVVAPLVHSRVVRWTLVGAGVYYALHQPALVTAAVGELAGLLGVPPLLAQTLFWTVVVLMVGFVLRSLLRVVFFFVKPLVGGMRIMAAAAKR